MFGQRNRAARKLDGEKVGEIRRRYESGETQSVLSREFGVSIGQIGRIVRGESWQNPLASPRRPASIVTEESLEELGKKLLALSAEVHGKAPRSPLDGGDAPDETGGAGSQALLEEAKKLA